MTQKSEQVKSRKKKPCFLKWEKTTIKKIDILCPALAGLCMANFF